MENEDQNQEGFLIPLKKKYLTKSGGSGGSYKGRTGNSNGRLKNQGLWKKIAEQGARYGKKKK